MLVLPPPCRLHACRLEGPGVRGTAVAACLHVAQCKLAVHLPKGRPRMQRSRSSSKQFACATASVVQAVGVELSHCIWWHRGAEVLSDSSPARNGVRSQLALNVHATMSLGALSSGAAWSAAAHHRLLDRTHSNPPVPALLSSITLSAGKKGQAV